MPGAIILAAGSSRRFGDDKRMARLASGKLIIQQAIENARSAFGHVILVLRYGDNLFEEEIDRLFFDPGLTTYKAPDSALGMGHSLANTMSQIPDWDGAFIFLADMPYIRRATLMTLKDSFEKNQDKAPIIVPTFNGQYGHPVGFHCDYFKELAQLSGDSGAKPVIEAHREKVVEVPVEDAGIVVDIDRPDDLAE